MKRSLSLLMERIGLFVPIFAERFIAAILHSPHGVFFRAVDVEHFAAIFGIVHVEHLTAPCGASAMGVIFVAYRFHGKHVIAAYAEIARFVK